MSIIEESFIVGVSYQPYINKLFIFIVVLQYIIDCVIVLSKSRPISTKCRLAFKVL